MTLDAHTEAMSHMIAEEIVRQNGVDNVDNLGDAESIVLTGACPTVNVVELSEKIIEWLEAKNVR